MSFFKKVVKFVHPGARQFLGNKGDGGQGYMNLGAANARNAAINDAMADYGKIEGNIRDSYTNAAKKAGTYANTNEFNSGLNSEIQAGVRGARVDAVNRIHALQRAAGGKEGDAGWFNPEGYDQTQGNTTKDKLAQTPPKDAEEAPVNADAVAQTAPTNSATSVQNTPSTSFASKMSAFKPGSLATRLAALKRQG